MAKILIVESDLNISSHLYAQLSPCNEVYLCDHSGMLLSNLMEYRPELVVIDLSLAGEDGIGLLKMAYTAGISPAIIASARFYSDYVEQQMSQFRTVFYFRRPITAQEMLPRIVDVLLGLGNEDPMDIRRLCNEILLRLGFNMCKQGYHYVVESIVYMTEHMNCMISNELYPDLAKAWGGNSKQVEHLIRTCIEDARNRGNMDAWRLYFPVDRHGNVIHLTNSAFLKRIAYAVNDYFEQYRSRNIG